MKKWLIALLITITAVPALAGGTAEAVSVYDNAYVPVELPFKWDVSNYAGNSYVCSPVVDGYTLTATNWATAIIEKRHSSAVSSVQMDTIYDSFMNAVDSPSGIWGATIHPAYTGSYGTIMDIFWSETSDSSARLEWTTVSGQQQVRLYPGTGIQPKRVQVNCSNGVSSPEVTTPLINLSSGYFTISSNGSAGGWSMNPLRSGYRSNIILSVPDGFNFNYPAGYEGEDIVTNFVPPPTILSDTPAIQLVSLGNFKFEFYDNNFVNYQVNEPPFYCGLNTIPDIIWQIIDDNATTIMSGDFKANKKAEFQHTPSQVDEVYTLYATYDCPDDPQIEFDSGVQIPYSTSSNGWLVAPTWNSCIIDGFPWVDVQECLNNLTRVIDTLSFGTMRVNNPDAWVVSEVCYNTTTLHTWLGSDTTFQLCPQFSEEIRNIVTPFVTFLLGLLTITFITKRTGSGFNG